MVFSTLRIDSFIGAVIVVWEFATDVSIINRVILVICTDVRIQHDRICSAFHEFRIRLIDQTVSILHLFQRNLDHAILAFAICQCGSRNIINLFAVSVKCDNGSVLFSAEFQPIAFQTTNDIPGKFRRCVDKLILKTAVIPADHINTGEDFRIADSSLRIGHCLAKRLQNMIFFFDLFLNHFRFDGFSFLITPGQTMVFLILHSNKSLLTRNTAGHGHLRADALQDVVFLYNLKRSIQFIPFSGFLILSMERDHAGECLIFTRCNRIRFAERCSFVNIFRRNQIHLSGFLFFHFAHFVLL